METKTPKEWLADLDGKFTIDEIGIDVSLQTLRQHLVIASGMNDGQPYQPSEYIEQLLIIYLCI